MAKKKTSKTAKRKARRKKAKSSKGELEHSSKDFLNARNMFRNGDFDGATRVLNNLVRREPQNFEALALLASCHSFLGNFEEAVKCHEVAIDKDPSDAQKWHSLASDLLNLGDLEKAEQAMMKALELDGKRGSSHYNLARIVARRGDFKKAFASLKKALKLQPDLRDSMTEQPDFAPLAEDDRFKQLVTPKKDDFDYPFFDREEA